MGNFHKPGNKLTRGRAHEAAHGKRVGVDKPRRLRNRQTETIIGLNVTMVCSDKTRWDMGKLRQLADDHTTVVGEPMGWSGEAAVA